MYSERKLYKGSKSVSNFQIRALFKYKSLFQTQGPYVTYRKILHTMLHSKLPYRAKEAINKI